MHVDEQRAVVLLRQRCRHVDRERRRADAPFGPDEREHLSADMPRALRDDARDRAADRVDVQRLGHALVDAGAHGVEHHIGRQCRHDEHHAGLGMLVLDDAQRGGNLSVCADVHDEHVRLRRGRVRQRQQIDRGRDARPQSAGANELFELAI